jgi:diphthine synthase
MTLYLIGLGLHDEKDITLRGLEIVKKANKVYLESYTAVLHCNHDRLEKLYGREVILAGREIVEKRGDDIVRDASKEDIAFLVVGDPVSATTHTDLLLRAIKQGISVEVVHNASVMTAVGIIGLQLYKYGRTTSIVFPQEGWEVEMHYNVIKENKEKGLHSLCLLDIKTDEPSKENLRKGKSGRDSAEKPRFMTVKEAIQNLLDIESRRKEGVFTEKTICVGCARLGSSGMKIKAGPAKMLLKEDFGGPMHCLVIPGNLHFVEEESLELWK